MSQRSDGSGLDRILADAAAGDASAWRVLVETYTRRVYGLIVRQCGDRDLAQEITQATFVQVVTHLRRYQESGRFEPWLFRIAMNLLRDEMRRRKRQARPMDMTPGAGRSEEQSAWSAAQDQIVEGRPSGAGSGVDTGGPLEQAQRAEQVEQLRAAVMSLPEADRQILELRHTAGLSFAQIAQSLGQPLGTVLARGHRALAKLRKMMQDQDDRDSTQGPKDEEG